MCSRCAVPITPTYGKLKPFVLYIGFLILHFLLIRFQLLPAQKEKSIYKSSAVESQAAKRQKLEGGRSQKVHRSS